MTSPAPTARLPWHSWLFACLILFLYGNGAWDFVKTMNADAAYLEAKGFAPEAVAYFTDYPVLLELLFATNVVTALAAGIALLLRARVTAALAVTSAGSMVVLDVVTYGFRGRWKALGPDIGWFDLGLLVITVGFAVYCLWAARRGLLR